MGNKNNNFNSEVDSISNFNSNIKIISVIIYNNADIDKSKIYEENKGKSGVYLWNNLVTGKYYVGSSISLSRRFSCYYSLGYLKNSLENTTSIVYSALLKYGYSNFSLPILEYCEPSKLIDKEQYYIDLLKPEYNILYVAGSRLGHKPSEETKQIISNTLKNRLTKLLPIKITNIETNIVRSFANNQEAAKHLGISVRTLGRYKSEGKILLKIYKITNSIYMNKSYK